MKKIYNARDLFIDDLDKPLGFDVVDPHFEHQGCADHWIGTVLSAASVVSSLWSTYQSGESAEEAGEQRAEEAARVARENAKISRYDALVAQKQADAIKAKTSDSLRMHYQAVDRYLSDARTAFAYSGVATTTGSPLQIQMESLRAGLKDAAKIIYNGKTAAEEAESLARRYEMLAEAGLRDAAAQATLINNAASMEANNIRWAGYSQSLTNLYMVGSRQGWWT